MEPIRRNAVFYLAAIVFFTLLALLAAQYVHREAAVSMASMKAAVLRRFCFMVYSSCSSVTFRSGR